MYEIDICETGGIAELNKNGIKLNKEKNDWPVQA